MAHPKQSAAESAAFHLWDARVEKTRDDGRPIFTVNELCDRWVRFAETYYRHPGEAYEAGTLPTPKRPNR